jgi:hypothetical protein
LFLVRQRPHRATFVTEPDLMKVVAALADRAPAFAWSIDHANDIAIVSMIIHQSQ